MIPGGYGQPAQVRAMLRAHESIVTQSDVDSRIDALNLEVSLMVDYETGRTFGEAAGETAELHWGGPYNTIVLNRPVTAITKITYGGTVSGTTMTGGTDILAADLVDVIRDPQGRIFAVRAGYGFSYWWWFDNPANYQTAVKTPVVVTATFDTFGYDADTDNNVPPDIQYVVNYMIVERLKVEKAGPSGAIGPTGDIIPVRDVFEDPFVKRTLNAHRSGIGLVV